MSINISQLRKLRGKSLKELRVRGAQEISKFSERALGMAGSEMSDAALAREIRPECFSGTIAETARQIIKHAQGLVASEARSDIRLFLPSPYEHKEIDSIMESRFPAQRVALIDKARRAILGNFDLLGIEQISFGDPIDWHLEPLSGKRTPLDHWSLIDYLNPDVAGDKKVTWELNRHQHFVTFGQAYLMTADERFAEAFVSQALSWMDANPPKRGINWASSLEVAFRSVSWIWALRLFAGSERMTSGFLLRVLKNLVAHGYHIESYLSHYFSPNTHLTGEALGLLYLGTALPELKRAEAWRKLGLRILIEQLPLQVQRDGVYFEQSAHYHRYTTDFYIHLLLFARANSIELPASVEATLANMIDYVMWTTRPDGSSSLLGDDDGGRLIKLSQRNPDNFCGTLAVGAMLFGRSDWKPVSCDAAVEILWLAGTEGLARYDALDSRPPQETTRAFEASGYYVMRDGWSPESSYVIISCTSHSESNCAHAHADALSFEFSSLGKNWLIDPGTFTYTGDSRLRNYFRSTQAHNTVTVDGQSQSVPGGPFSWSYRADAQKHEFTSQTNINYFEGSHNGYERLGDAVTHRRSILFAKALVEKHSSLPSYLIVRDRFIAQGSHHYELRYHLSPDCDVMTIGNRVKVTHADGDILDLSVFGSAIARVRIEEGWTSRGYGHREMSPVVVFEVEGESSQQLTTLIIPSRKEKVE
jgi:hypothetical protein